MVRDFHQSFITAECAVVFVLEGCLTLKRPDGVRHVAGPGEAAKRFPQELHALDFTAGTRSAYLAIPASAVAMLTSAGVPALDAPILRPSPSPSWEGRWRMLAARMETNLGSGHAFIETRLNLVSLFTDLHVAHAMADPEEEALIKARELLEREQSLTIPEVARRCELSYSTFRERFRKRFGRSPLAWQRGRRLESAMHLLMETDLPIAEVARRCGYGQASRLSQQFRTEQGCSPREWRSRHGRWVSGHQAWASA